MSDTSDDEIVVTDGRTTQGRRLYRWLLDHLAKFPGRVTVVTFAAGVVVTIVVVAVGGESSPATVVSLVATLWALFFAVMIYLLTARDTDKVLEQIADLHEQLATALAAPDEEEIETAAAEEHPDASPAAPVDVSSSELERDFDRGQRRPGAPESAQNRAWPPTGGVRRPHLLVGEPDIVAGVPKELLDAWKQATDRSTDELSRAWTRDPRSDRQWVLESDGGSRWVIFSKGSRGIGVMPLDHRGGGRGPREMQTGGR
jgi:hypothetical protein